MVPWAEESASVARPGSGAFEALLAELASHHHRELQVLREEISRLREASAQDDRQVSPQACKQVSTWASEFRIPSPPWSQPSLSRQTSSKASTRPTTQRLISRMRSFDSRQTHKHIRRMGKVFSSTQPGKKTVTAEDLGRLLLERGGINIDDESLHTIFMEFASAAERCQQEGINTHGEIPVSTFVALLNDEHWLCSVSDENVDIINKIKRTLLAEHVDELINTASRSRRILSGGTEEFRSKSLRGEDKALLRLHIIVSITVMLSILVLGMSMDYHPGLYLWTVLEALFAAVFTAEVCVKLYFWGPRKYFCGPFKLNNVFDLAITALSLADVVMSIMQALIGELYQFSVARLLMVLRAARFVRVVRLMKLLKGPFLKELANMLSGFLIGMPVLLWVMFLLAFVIYILALALRALVGPPEGSDLISECGPGDAQVQGLDISEQGECKICNLYAEEYVSSVTDAMFLVFRCSVGDCSSRGGQALAAHMSACYSWKFHLAYYLGMVSIVFGLFNITTAVFVQATMDGLRCNQVESTLARKYESQQVRRNLDALLQRVLLLAQDGEDLCSLHGVSRCTVTECIKDLAMDERLFSQVLQDPVVSQILEALDVRIDHRLNVFSVFDTSNDGFVSLEEMIRTVMKMRGEPQKIDMVASWALLEGMRDQIHELQQLTVANQKAVLEVIKDRDLGDDTSVELESGTASEFA